MVNLAGLVRIAFHYAEDYSAMTGHLTIKGKFSSFADPSNTIELSV